MRPAAGRIPILVLVLALTSGTAAGQESVHVRVETNYPAAVLYVDSTLIGSVSREAVAVPSAGRMIRLVPPDANTWSIAPVASPLQGRPGDTVTVALDFPYHYRVESVPFGASVLIESDVDRTLIGETPLLYRSKDPIEGQLLVRRDGYAVERVAPGSEIWNRHVVDLSPAVDLDPTAAQVQWTPPRKHRAWIEYAALGSAVVAGALAVHYKFRADDLHAQYEDTADPEIRSDIRRYDTRSAVALGTMQVGIGVFAIRLALR